jgi:3-oxoacyl-[acyl-carrier protein] reductase
MTTSRTALVTGSTKGIGLDIAKRLASSFSHLGINGRNLQDIEAVVKSSNKFFPAVANANNLEEVLSLRDLIKSEFGNLDLLVCNIGGGVALKTPADAEEWQRVLNLNLYSAINFVEIMKDIIPDQTGKIIFIGSIAENSSVDAPLPYSVAKAALNLYSKKIAKEFAARGIRVNSLILGNILFEGSSWQKRIEKEPQETLSYIHTNVPLNIFGTTSEIAAWCEFLSSDEIRFTTGATIYIDGGQTL